MPFRILERGNTVVDKRLNASALLWRYIDAAKFLDFLHYSRLYFCRGDLFEDKFEGQFTQSWKRSIEHSYKENNINFTYEKFRHRLRQQIFLSCWHQSDAENMALWRIYGDSSCSVALTTTVDCFRTALDKQDLPYLVSIEKVDYVDYTTDPELDLSPYSRIFAYKHSAYEFEKEVRVILDLDRQGHVFDTPIEKKGLYVPINPSSFLKNIVVAPNAPSWFVDLVFDVAKDSKISIKPSALAVDPI